MTLALKIVLKIVVVQSALSNGCETSESGKSTCKFMRSAYTNKTVLKSWFQVPTSKTQSDPILCRSGTTHESRWGKFPCKSFGRRPTVQLSTPTSRPHYHSTIYYKATTVLKLSQLTTRSHACSDVLKRLRATGNRIVEHPQHTLSTNGEHCTKPKSLTLSLTWHSEMLYRTSITITGRTCHLRKKHKVKLVQKSFWSIL